MDQFLRVCLESVIDCAQGVAGRAAESLSLGQTREITCDSSPCPGLECAR
jgi:hypothetical protein